MKKIFPVLCKIAAVCIAFVLILMLITPVFVPKFTEDFPTTLVINGFYELPEDSIDVLFLGSSQIMTSVSPMQIYETYGYTGYNLGTEQQNMVASYYLLREVLAYQKLQVVFLDIMFLFPYAQDYPLNSREEFVRKSIDCMKWSANKLAYVRTVCALDSEYEMSSYLFPFLRYHSRWADLTLKDFTYSFEDKTNPLRGYAIATRIEKEDQFSGFQLTGSSSMVETLPPMEEYFYKIVQLCEENNISLVLFKTPKADGSFSEGCHNTIQNIATEHNLDFIDFNEKSVYDAIHFDASTDYNDSTHINYLGAYKITGYLGDYLAEHYTLTDYRNVSDYENWNSDLQIYKEQIEQAPYQ